MGIVRVRIVLDRRRRIRAKIWIGRLLNWVLVTNLWVCASCDRYTSYHEDRLWGPFMLCPRCDGDLNDQLCRDEAAWEEAGKVPGGGDR